MSDNKVTLDQLDNSAINAMTSSIGDVNELNTENKTIVGALAEIVGKKEIANAIGEPLNDNDTFEVMSNKIDVITEKFRNNLSDKGVVLEGTEDLNTMADMIPDGIGPLAPLKISIQTELPDTGVENEFIIIHNNINTEIVFYDTKVTTESSLPEECIVICTPHDCTMFEIKCGIIPFNISLGEIYYKNGNEYTELEIYNYKNGVWQLYSNNIVISKFIENHPYTYSQRDAAYVTVNTNNVYAQANSNGAGLWGTGIIISGLPAGKYKFTVECAVSTNSTVAGNVYISEYQSETSTSYDYNNQHAISIVLNRVESDVEFSLTVYASGGTNNVTGLSITNAKLIRLYD
jgi:hypothetical protein